MDVKRFIGLAVLAVLLAGIIMSVILIVAFLLIKLIEIFEDLL